MSLPAYAQHMSPEQYEDYQNNWHRFYFRPDATDIKTPEDAAAFFMIAALDRENDDGSGMPVPPSLYNDGRSIGSTAALIQYQPDLAAAGLEIALTQYFDLNSHGLEALAYVVETVNYWVSDLFEPHTNKKWTPETLTKLLKTTREVNMNTLVEDLKNKDTNPSIECNIFFNTLAAAHRHLISHPNTNLTELKIETVNNIKHYLDHTDHNTHSNYFHMTLAELFDFYATDDDKAQYGPKLAHPIAASLNQDKAPDFWPYYEELSMFAWLKPLVEQELPTGHAELGRYPSFEHK